MPTQARLIEDAIVIRERLRDEWGRRELLKHSAMALVAALSGCRGLGAGSPGPVRANGTSRSDDSNLVRLFLCGDVMTGRGIDQVLPHPSYPRLHEPYLASALHYVDLAERANGPIPRPVDFAYVWGDALAELERMSPDVRIVNLETAVTRSDDWLPRGINYRMHPENVACLMAAAIDCCVLANNHVLDWGHAGLTETLKTLWEAKMTTAGAGRGAAEAATPAIQEIGNGRRVVTFAFGSTTSGIPRDWAAAEHTPGVNLLEEGTVRRMAADVRSVKRPGDVFVASLHWGGNWGYEIPRQQMLLAHRLIDEAGIDVVHGHSSHHLKGIEVYSDKPVLYGCGDFLNDYEGIEGHEEFRSDLALMYFVTFDPSAGRLVRLEMTPLRIRRFRLNRVSREEAHWLRDTLHRECAKLGTRVGSTADDRLRLGWADGAF
jgi:poly-gamma-glutamate synthesis protein (capsule biosynthesis protein)